MAKPQLFIMQQDAIIERQTGTIYLRVRDIFDDEFLNDPGVELPLTEIEGVLCIRVDDLLWCMELLVEAFGERFEMQLGACHTWKEYQDDKKRLIAQMN